MSTSIGDVVGYMVKGDSKSSHNTKIVFCTYGVMLRRLQVGKTNSIIIMMIVIITLMMVIVMIMMWIILINI